MPETYTCTIVSAGASEYTVEDVPDSAIWVGLTDLAGSFQTQWFYATGDMQNQILAVALSAISTGRQVIAVLDPPDAGDGKPRPPQCYELDVITVPQARASGIS